MKRSTLKTGIALALGFAAAGTAAAAWADPTIDYVGYDVAAQALVISGSDFGATGAPAVEIGGQAAEVISSSDGLIMVRVPELAADRTVTVTRGGRSASAPVRGLPDALWPLAVQAASKGI